MPVYANGISGVTFVLRNTYMDVSCLLKYWRTMHAYANRILGVVFIMTEKCTYDVVFVK